MASPNLPSIKQTAEHEDEGIFLQREEKELHDPNLHEINPGLSEQPTRSSTRIRKPPEWLATEEIART